ncbi:MAG: glycosyltransferase family 2 protein [Caldilinea sp.]|nr:glycosyltransferase family 2 protein [Caldilinea sp.]
MIDLSVIILTHNTCDLTRRCLRSLAAAPAAPYSSEVIVVDNASTDDTIAMVAQEFPTVRVIANDANEGFARGNNIGLAAAAGRYLLLLNSDTEVLPGALAALVHFMDTHRGAGGAGPMLLNTDGSLQPSGRNLPTPLSVLVDTTKIFRLWKRDLYRDPRRDYSQVVRVGEISGAALLVRRECYHQVGGLDPAFFAYYEDVDWCKRIGDAGWEIYYVPAAQVAHLWQGTSRQVSQRAYQAGQESLRYYFHKHHGPPKLFAVSAMLAGKELLRVVGSLLRRDRAEFAFHIHMLAALFVPPGAAR